MLNTERISIANFFFNLRPQLLTFNNGSIKDMSDVTNPIPKIIHYVWVGGKPLTPLAEQCFYLKNQDVINNCWCTNLA